VSLDRSPADRLQSLIAPFDGEPGDGRDGTGVAIAIEDRTGVVVAFGGIADPGATVKVRHEIEAGGRRIGQVVGTGTADPRLIEAIVASVAAGVSALAESGPDSSEQAAAAIRIEAELALGRRIQRSFIPLVPPTIPGYEIASHYEAAREVGGDFFDVFRIRTQAGRLAVCIADVTGKGIAAALMMAFARPLLHAAIDNARAPAAALEQTNRILVEERRSALFITALCATVDLRRGTLRLANAGHEPPLLVAADGSPIRWLEGSGPLLGAFARLDLIERTVELAPGDLVLLYTDGVTDAQSPGLQRFGDGRLIDAVEAARGGSATDVVETVCGAYHAFQADQPNADDVTIVAIRRAPRASRRR